jgi:hypothetical protein
MTMQASTWALATVFGLLLTSPAPAEPKLQRVALQLTGLCTAQHRQAAASLSTVEGVRRADAALVPEHIVVDLDPNILTAQEFAALVARVLEHTECRAVPMESCITAAPTSHQAGVPPDARGHSH